MNIKQTAEQSGVSARNIRYYEQAGLLTPARNPENEYRVYSQADVRALKLIRMLRTLDMPVEEIGTVLNGTLPLAEAAERQRQRLEAEQQKLAAAAAFCTELAAGDRTAAELDVDSCLKRMQAPAPAGGWFTAHVLLIRRKMKNRRPGLLPIFPLPCRALTTGCRKHAGMRKRKRECVSFFRESMRRTVFLSHALSGKSKERFLTAVHI